jgi:hypothetical protein
MLKFDAEKAKVLLKIYNFKGVYPVHNLMSENHQSFGYIANKLLTRQLNHPANKGENFVKIEIVDNQTQIITQIIKGMYFYANTDVAEENSINHKVTLFLGLPSNTDYKGIKRFRNFVYEANYPKVDIARNMYLRLVKPLFSKLNTYIFYDAEVKDKILYQGDGKLCKDRVYG